MTMETFLILYYVSRDILHGAVFGASFVHTWISQKVIFSRE